MGSMKEIFNSLLLRELFKGMSVTGRYMFARKITVQYPEEKNAAKLPFSRPACATSLSQWRGALYCLQVVRSGLPGAGDHH